MTALETLQAEGCPLAYPWDALYRQRPHLLVALHNAAVKVRGLFFVNPQNTNLLLPLTHLLLPRQKEGHPPARCSQGVLMDPA